MAGYFVEFDWQLLLGVLPSYWPAKSFWVASEGGVFWFYTMEGLLTNLPVGLAFTTVRGELEQ